MTFNNTLNSTKAIADDLVPAVRPDEIKMKYLRGLYLR